MSEIKKKSNSTLVYKIVAIVMALLLWFYVYQSQNPLTEQVFNLPLQPIELDSDLIMVDSNITVQVRVQGQEKNLKDTQLKDLTAYVNLAGLAAGEHEVNVYVNLPDNLQMVSVSPFTLTVALENIQSITVPIQLEFENSLPSSALLMLDPVLNPVEVVIYGASTYLEEIGSAFVSLDLAQAAESINASYPIRLRDTSGHEINQTFSFEPETVSVYLPIVSNQPERQMTVSTPIAGTPASGYQISRIVTEPAIVRAFGSTQALLDLRTLDTLPLDISGATANLNTTVDLVLPAGITTETRSIQVSITIEAVKERTILKSLVYNNNLPPGHEVAGEDQLVAIRVTGPASFIEELNEGDILTYVDLQGLTEGQHQLDVQVSLPPNISLADISPASVTVELKALEP